MSRTYDLLAESFHEILSDYEATGGKHPHHDRLTIDIAPVKKYTGAEVRSIRLKNNLTQSFLAQYLCVSKKTIEAWEAGRNTPNGPSSRLLALLDTQSVSFAKA